MRWHPLKDHQPIERQQFPSPLLAPQPLGSQTPKGEAENPPPDRPTLSSAAPHGLLHRKEGGPPHPHCKIRGTKKVIFLSPDKAERGTSIGHREVGDPGGRRGLTQRAGSYGWSRHPGPGWWGWWACGARSYSLRDGFGGHPGSAGGWRSESQNEGGILRDLNLQVWGLGARVPKRVWHLQFGIGGSNPTYQVH